MKEGICKAWPFLKCPAWPTVELFQKAGGTGPWGLSPWLDSGSLCFRSLKFCWESRNLFFFFNCLPKSVSLQFLFCKQLFQWKLLFFCQITNFPFEENRLEGKFSASPSYQTPLSSFCNPSLWVLCAPLISALPAYLTAPGTVKLWFSLYSQNRLCKNAMHFH